MKLTNGYSGGSQGDRSVLSDESLLGLIGDARRGNVAALSTLVSATAPRVRVMVAVRSPPRIDEQLREDIVQEVLMVLVESLPTFTISCAAEWSALVSRITENKCVDSIRRDGRNREVRHADQRATIEEPDVSSIPVIWGVIATSDPSPSSHAFRREALQILIEELRRMSEAHREVIILAFVDGLNTSEIGARLGISRTAAANRVFRARLELVRRWGERTKPRRSPE